MPQIDSIPEVLYQPNQPYHYIYDNLPLRNILTRIGLVNSQVDTTAGLLRGLAGTAGSPSARIGVSLNQDGSLRSDAVDEAGHNIGRHEDGFGTDGVSYVRMTADERAKLEQIQSEANRLVVEVEDGPPNMGNLVTLTDGTLSLRGSSSVFFDFEAPNIVRAHSAFPPDTAHRHHYSLVPVPYVSSSSSSGPRSYKTTSYATKYNEGTLRVYINGMRVGTSPVRVPDASGSNFAPINVVSESPSEGTFTLSRTLSSNDVITIDFDEYFIMSPLSPNNNSIVYNIQPFLSNYWQSEFGFNNQIEITCQVSIGSSLVGPLTVVWELSTDGGATWTQPLAFSSPGWGGNNQIVSPGVMNERIILLDVGPSVNGWKFRVTNSKGSASATSNVFTLHYPFNNLNSSSSS